jgi:hypothetical protein
MASQNEQFIRELTGLESAEGTDKIIDPSEHKE